MATQAVKRRRLAHLDAQLTEAITAAAPPKHSELSPLKRSDTLQRSLTGQRARARR